MFAGGNFRAGTSPSKSFYMSAGDFCFSEKIQFNYNSNVVREVAVDQSQVQPIILNEFQPDTVVYDTKLMLSALDAGLNIAKNIPGVKEIMKGVQSFVRRGFYKKPYRKRWTSYG